MLHKVYLATGNPGKVRSYAPLLQPLGFDVLHYSFRAPEPRSQNLELVAHHKALSAFVDAEKPVLVTDVGFYVDALRGHVEFPGTYVNQFLKTNHAVERLLRMVAPDESRVCESRTALAFMEPGMTSPKVFQSKLRGRLADSPRGEMREWHLSELARIFMPNGSSKTEAEMSFEEYNKLWMEKYMGPVVHDFAQWFSKRKENGQAKLPQFS